MGFHRAKGEPMFIRESTGRKEIFWLIYTPDPDSAEVSAAVAVAFEPIEALMRENSGLYHNPGKYTMSVAEDVWRIDPGMQMVIRTTADAALVLDMLVRCCNQYGSPFYERFQTVRDVANYLTPSTVGSGNLAINCSVGVIAKRLVNAEDYVDFVDYCRNRLSQDPSGFYLKKFERLLERLQVSMESPVGST
jgi:hypothetical protein